MGEKTVAKIRSTTLLTLGLVLSLVSASASGTRFGDFQGLGGLGVINNDLLPSLSIQDFIANLIKVRFKKSPMSVFTASIEDDFNQWVVRGW